MVEIVEQLKQRAAELLQSPRLTNEHIDAMNELGWQLRYVDVSLVAELSAEALQLSTRNDYLRGRAFALLGVGEYQHRTDQYKKAEQNLEESRQLFLHLRDDTALASVTNSLAISKQKLGSYEAALNNYSVVLSLREKLNDSVGVAGVLSNFGNIHFYIGDYGQSLEYYYRGLQTAIDCAALVFQAHTYCSLGGVLWRVGEAEVAIECSEQALALFKMYPDQHYESGTLNNMAAAQQSRGKHQEAFHNYQQGLALAQTAYSVENQVEAKIGIGSIYCKTNEAEQALGHLSDALQLSQSIGSRFYESQALFQLGTAYKQIGDERESIQMLESALEISQELNIKEVCYKTHLALSEVYQKQGKLAAALAHHQDFHKHWQEIYGLGFSHHIQRLLLQNELNRLPHKLKLSARYDAAIRRSAIHSSSQARTRHDKASSGLSPHKLKQVIEFINHNLARNLSLIQIAEVTGLNYDHFIRVFKKSIGKTPYRFLIEQRVGRAQLLLKTTTLPLAEITLQCGFSTQQHFTTHFRLVTGTTPGKYRRSK